MASRVLSCVGVILVLVGLASSGPGLGGPTSFLHYGKPNGPLAMDSFPTPAFTSQAGPNATPTVESSTTTLVATISTGSQPYASAFDPADGYVYVPNSGGSNVTVIDGKSAIASLAVGAQPFSATYDAADGYVYVPTTTGVYVLEGLSVIGSVLVSGAYYFAAADPVTGLVYATNLDYATTDVINRTTLVANLSTDCPVNAVYDGADGDVYVLSNCVFGNSTVSVINGTSVVGHVPVGASPMVLVYDTGNGDVYCLNQGVSGNISTVTVIHGTTVVGTVTVGHYGIAGKGHLFSFPAYDPRNGYVYVPNGGSANVSVLYGASLVASVPVPDGPLGVTAAGNSVLVEDTDSNNVTVIGGTGVVSNVSVGTAPVYGVYDPANGYVYVSNLRSSNVSVLLTKAVPPRGSPVVERYEVLAVALAAAVLTVLSVLMLARHRRRCRKLPPPPAPGAISIPELAPPPKT